MEELRSFFYAQKGRETKNIEWRWKLCAQELHWHVRNVSSGITTRRRIRKPIQTAWKPKSIVDFAKGILCTRKPNKECG